MRRFTTTTSGFENYSALVTRISSASLQHGHDGPGRLSALRGRVPLRMSLMLCSLRSGPYRVSQAITSFLIHTCIVSFSVTPCQALKIHTCTDVRADSHLRLGPSQTIHGMRLMATVERRSTMMVHVSVTPVWLVVSVSPTYSVND
jgi:hypothetical protein